MNGFTSISLSGTWVMEYRSPEPYKDTAEPTLEGCVIENAVPGYWEDMIEVFQETFLYTRLAWNPSYGPQRYPIAGYVPDMALPTIYGTFFYQRTVSLESLLGVKKIKLHIGGAQNAVGAWINGVYLGRHEGYSAPFDFEIPREAVKEGENRITLAVSNSRIYGYKGGLISGCTARAANDYTGGIYGDVEIRLFKAAPEDMWVITSKDLSSFTVYLDEPADADYAVSIYDGCEKVKSAFIKCGYSSVSFSTEGLSFWSPESPKRYTARAYSEEYSIECKFGIRRLTADGTRLRLNGRLFYARGICEHGYYPITVHPPRDKGYYRAVIKKLKELGFNFVRFHTTVPMPEYMEAADELGIIMEIETPNNTTVEEWGEVVRYCRKYTAPVMYSSGNEMMIDEDYIEHLKKCAALVHENTDALFSPMSAMRGIEYYDYGDCCVEEPFKHNPKRLAVISEFCDLYNSYPNGWLSYFSAQADPEYIDKCNVIYKKPLLSHEICINGTYCDLSLKDRYRNSRIGKTALYSSVEEHLIKKGLIDRAPLYYKNSSEWQRRLRKQCFEAARRCDSLAGYDYLGDIDHHWHTFGYCVGMMNEFYELKPGETVENVRRYNSDTVLLADLPYSVNYECGEPVKIPLHVSNYGESMKAATLRITVLSKDKVWLRREIKLAGIPSGEITKLTNLEFNMPRTEKPVAIKLSVRLSSGDVEVENEWELYAFPRAEFKLPTSKSGIRICDDISEEALVKALGEGERVLLFGAGPFATLGTAFQIALAGRTAGHLGTVISDCPLMEDFPHEGFCSWQFRCMLDGGKSTVLDFADIPFEPLVEAVSTYKYAHREALIFEYRVGGGRLLVCTLNLPEDDAGARWLKAKILNYAMSDEFSPRHELSFEDLKRLFNTNPIYVAENTNMARNTNDLTM